MSDLVTVFQSSDVALLALAKAALDEAGYNQILGPRRIRVTLENAARARDVLRELCA